jgi:cytochrome b
MTRILVWDLPTRLFHWLLAGSFLAAFAVAVTTDDDGALFPVHMLLGLVVAFMVVLRLVWGVIGSRHSRFSGFAWNPKDLVAYLKEAFSGGAGRLWAGHNPGSTWAAAVMLACALGLAGTGLLMSQGSEVAEEVHEVLAWTLLATVGVHLAGIAWHTLRHREVIALSMVDGRKRGDPAEAIASSRPLAGLAFLGLTGAWAGGLVTSYDPADSTVTLPLIGELTLGEGEEHGHEGHGGEEEDEEGEEDHD